MPDEPQSNWDKMNKTDRGKTATFFARVDGVKALIFTLVGALLTAQPFWQAYYKNADSTRASEIMKNEKQADSAMALAKAAISEVTQLSAQQGELKAENQSLRRELAELTEKYKEMEVSYLEAVKEKKALELRIDELFRQNLKK